MPWIVEDEEIFASKNILYHGQPIGVVAATSASLALTAAELVKVKYKKKDEKPVLDIKDALAAPDKDRRVGTCVKYVLRRCYIYVCLSQDIRVENFLASYRRLKFES